MLYESPEAAKTLLELYRPRLIEQLYELARVYAVGVATSIINVDSEHVRLCAEQYASCVMLANILNSWEGKSGGPGAKV